MGNPEVLIDGRHLSGFGAARGFGRYLRSLIPYLAQEPSMSLSVLVQGAPGLPPNVKPQISRRLAWGRTADREHRLRLQVDIARSAADVFHSSASDPPLRCSRPWVQTLHDVPLAFEDANGRHEFRKWRKRRRSVRSADAVIAVSRHVADVATELLDLDPDRLTVVPHGVSSAFSAPPRRLHGAAHPADDDAYLLLVSEYGPHKGYAEAFAAISALAERGFPHRLVVAGTVAPWWRPEIERHLKACSHPERVYLAGHVIDRGLAELYSNADALIITSRAEGFGLPAIEAMACGTPVIAFDNTALPEVIGTGGLLVRDGDVEALTETVASVVGDRARWREASSQALARSTRFSWEECARSHVEVYARVAGVSS